MGAQSPRQSLLLAVATGVVSILPIGRAPRGVKAALAAGTGLTAGGAAFVALRRPDLIAAAREPVPARQSAVVSAGLGVLAAGATVAGIATDRAFERALVRRGVAHPRLVLGVAGAVLSYAMDVLDRRSDTDD
ncbi:hypothetical protein [Aeromicrobium duanguangcaii]|uniref:Uncharacterized protein n=1 Tax=Aeromicrobium duanguangcaii TaxID=2968086 RepID=A0ABY5KHX3_9ACTN|nr:hypothetical protein [Aeromicrobium duanguangcaii]MCD9153566.1 hypothetical protein [Aeromicrobium duanguangcaii]UUI69348.1 hypothetical protein NP095_04395 [Aeromicrobium duanguangcaii]